MIIELNPEHPEPRKIRQAADALERGEVIAYPTDTVYGFGCDLMDKRAIDRLYQVKGAPKSQRLTFICPDLRTVSHYAIVHDWVYRILKDYLPGPYCFILEATKEVPRIAQSKRKTVGVRIPAHPVPVALVEALGRPVISSTANGRHGEPHTDVRELIDEFPGLALALDGGPGGLVPTSVVDLTGPSPVIIREGLGDVSDFR